MRRAGFLVLCASTLLLGQSLRLDEGRLDPAWFSSGAVFQPSKALGFQWLKPGLDLRNRTLRVKAWEPAAWLLGKRETKDQLFFARVEGQLESKLTAGLKKGLKGKVAFSTTDGDVAIISRVVDALDEAGDYLSVGGAVLSFDIKLVDGDTGELLGAFHDTLKGPNPDTIPLQFGRWAESLGQVLGTAVNSPANVMATPAPAQPAFDLDGALRRIDGLKRDGLISEEEYKALRKKAHENGAGKAH